MITRREQGPTQILLKLMFSGLTLIHGIDPTRDRQLLWGESARPPAVSRARRRSDGPAGSGGFDGAGGSTLAGLRPDPWAVDPHQAGVVEGPVAEGWEPGGVRVAPVLTFRIRSGFTFFSRCDVAFRWSFRAVGFPCLPTAPGGW